MSRQYGWGEEGMSWMRGDLESFAYWGIRMGRVLGWGGFWGGEGEGDYDDKGSGRRESGYVGEWLLKFLLLYYYDCFVSLYLRARVISPCFYFSHHFSCSFPFPSSLTTSYSFCILAFAQLLRFLRLYFLFGSENEKFVILIDRSLIFDRVCAC